ncbi:MAG: hypothetical protein J6S72_09500 [Lachnospiraceae bacterium]|nr:hypothetical protein [Lachnospiraceae bacterium]
MTNINMFNNIFSPTQAQTTAAANTGAGTAASSGAAEAAANAGLTAADELMEQLMDDRNAAHTQSATATVLQALKAAGLAESSANIALANALIENNLSISRESLRYFAAQAKAYPESGLDALMAMARADIPVNAESVATVNEFMNNGMVMTSDVNALADMIETVLSDPTTSPELADSIRQWRQLPEGGYEGNGFTFRDPDPAELYYAAKGASDLWYRPKERALLIESMMTTDFSWDRSAEEYLALYRETAGS